MSNIQDGWIAVEDRLPDHGQKVLAYCHERGMRETRFDRWPEGSINRREFGDDAGYFDWHEPQSHWASNWKPSHWRLLPEPPEAA